MRIQLSLRVVLRGVAVPTALSVLAGCSGLAPAAMPTINEKTAWSGYVFDERERAAVAEHLSDDDARGLIAGYAPSLTIVSLHPGELAPNVNGPTYVGYVVEVVRGERTDVLPILINAEEGAVTGGPGVDASDRGPDQ